LCGSCAEWGCPWESCLTTSVRRMRRPLRRCLDGLGAQPVQTWTPVLDAVAGKGFEPEVMMVTLQSSLTGVPYEELPNGELLAIEAEDGPWIVQLSEELRDALADAQPSRPAAIAEQWVRTEEFGEQATAPPSPRGERRGAGDRCAGWPCRPRTRFGHAGRRRRLGGRPTPTAAARRPDTA
jgi:hypothetical protein